MSYKIRYHPTTRCEKSTGRVLLYQTAVSVLIWCILSIARLSGLTYGGAFLSSGPVTVTERAVFAAAQTVSEGEGWGKAALTWCRIVLDLPL